MSNGEMKIKKEQIKEMAYDILDAIKIPKENRCQADINDAKSEAEALYNAGYGKIKQAQIKIVYKMKERIWEHYPYNDILSEFDKMIVEIENEN